MDRAADEIRVLITTDNHLGFAERDPIRGEDSFNAFEEVFEHALRSSADLVLMCGDLFHEASPSKYTLYRTVQILQKYCVGDRPIQIECVPNGNLQKLDKTERAPNYYSENINISLPVFSIHGNHDEPSGLKGVASLDILAETGLVNYFGAVDSLSPQIRLHPITLRKGSAALNLYGIGALRDERMSKLFAEERVQIEVQREGCNVFVLHQTRCDSHSKSYVPENLLSKEMDLVVWGHMHASHPVPVKNYQMGFSTIQPGSTVQTSLSQSETGDKHCVLLTVGKGRWETKGIRISSSRRFVLRTLAIGKEESAEEWVRSEMLKALGECGEEPKPLIRLRVEVEEDGQKRVLMRRALEEFSERVANPREILRIVQKRKRPEEGAQERGVRGVRARFEVSVDGAKILPESAFVQGIMESVEREDRAAIRNRYEEIIGGVIASLEARKWTDIEQEIPLAVRETEQAIMCTEIEKKRGEKAVDVSGLGVEVEDVEGADELAEISACTGPSSAAHHLLADRMGQDRENKRQKRGLDEKMRGAEEEVGLRRSRVREKLESYYKKSAEVFTKSVIEDSADNEDKISQKNNKIEDKEEETGGEVEDYAFAFFWDK